MYYNYCTVYLSIRNRKIESKTSIYLEVLVLFYLQKPSKRLILYFLQESSTAAECNFKRNSNVLRAISEIDF